jgi:hypothetical protein
MRRATATLLIDRKTKNGSPTQLELAIEFIIRKQATVGYILWITKNDL